MNVVQHTMVFTIICELSSAQLRRCLAEKDQPRICFKAVKGEKGYVNPFPVALTTKLHLKEIVSIDENEKSITMVMNLATYWKDPRITISNETTKNVVEVEKKMVKPLWYPLMDFEKRMDLVQSKVFGSTMGGTMGYYEDTNQMVYAEAFKLKFSCPFDFDNFPFESNLCCLSYGDFRNGNGASNVTLMPAIIIYDNMTTTEGPIIFHSLPFPYKINITSKLTFNKVEKGRLEKGDDILYSKTGMCFDLKRSRMGHLASAYYYPTTAFALLSMISYLINPDTVPGRMGMIVTLYLISANVYNSVKAPEGRGFSYIEIWMIGTQIPILLALVEYGFILYLKKISKNFDNKTVMPELGKPKQNLDDKIKKLDFATMIFSFIYFIIFATVYWIVARN